MVARHVILDRDGVLNREPPDGSWVARPEDWEWEPGALEALRRLAAAGVVLSVATNQSGVGRGVFAMDALEAVTDLMLRDAEDAGAPIDAVFVCPHAPEDLCDCRKPMPGLIEEAIDWSGVPREETVVVGDAPRDLDAAAAANVRAVLVRTGKGRETERTIGTGAVAVYDDLRSAAEAIVMED
mgnify:FL=1